MFDCEEPGDQTILDPTAGNGNLLVGALIAGIGLPANFLESTN